MTDFIAIDEDTAINPEHIVSLSVDAFGNVGVLMSSGESHIIPEFELIQFVDFRRAIKNIKSKKNKLIGKK